MSHIHICKYISQCIQFHNLYILPIAQGIQCVYNVYIVYNVCIMILAKCHPNVAPESMISISVIISIIISTSSSSSTTTSSSSSSSSSSSVILYIYIYIYTHYTQIIPCMTGGRGLHDLLRQQR